MEVLDDRIWPLPASSRQVFTDCQVNTTPFPRTYPLIQSTSQVR
jgi:hypothetical protein